MSHPDNYSVPFSWLLAATRLVLFLVCLASRQLAKHTKTLAKRLWR